MTNISVSACAVEPRKRRWVEMQGYRGLDGEFPAGWIIIGCTRMDEKDGIGNKGMD